MIFVPVLNDSLGRVSENGFLFRHATGYINPADPDIEGSHIHEFYEIYINISGDVSFLHNKTIYHIQPGDIIFSRPGEFHYCIYHSEKRHEHCCIWFQAEYFSDLADYINKQNLSGHIRPDEQSGQKIFSIIKSLGEASHKIERTTMFLNLITLMNNTSPSDMPKLPEKLREILNYIDTSFTEIRFIDDIAERFHISISTLNRWFRTYINLKPTALLQAKKLSYSKMLLKSDYSVTEACFMSGFSDCSRFIIAFRKAYGMTPLQYKKAGINKPPKESTPSPF